ncbi:RsmD family RNA methyltransferase [Candidatus Woesearchaeota archaeon]|nr:RsmD family RNA methyltransferase [Candidatus Woesearchaeota archaeon]
MLFSKRNLTAILSQLKSFEKPSAELEQYATPPEIAVDWIWHMAQSGEVAGKVILDAACGPGILGLGLLLLGAKKVYFLDKDEKIIRICRENYELLKKEYEIGAAEFVLQDITLLDAESTGITVVVQNPPFGTKIEHADKKFLEKAFAVAPLVYSMHKWSTQKFVEAVAKDFGFEITSVWKYEFRLPATQSFHKKPVEVVDVGLWKMERKK